MSPVNDEPVLKVTGFVRHLWIASASYSHLDTSPLQSEYVGSGELSRKKGRQKPFLLELPSGSGGALCRLLQSSDQLWP